MSEETKLLDIIVTQEARIVELVERLDKIADTVAKRNLSREQIIETVSWLLEKGE